MQRRTNDFMLSLPNRASDASLLQWASDVRPLEGPSKGRVDEFIEGLCSRFDSYWPDHQDMVVDMAIAVSGESATISSDRSSGGVGTQRGRSPNDSTCICRLVSLKMFC